MPDAAQFLHLYKGNLVPLRTVLPCLTWILHDYFVTLEDEIKYIWTQDRCLGKFMFLWIRYYTIFLLLFDVTQIHLFARPGIASDDVCVAMDPTTRLIGAIALWSVEIILQLRIYALYECNKKIAALNACLFMCSVASFTWILIHNATKRAALIATAIHLPLPGCPSIHAGIEWLLWVPATIFEGVLFLFALYKTLSTTAHRVSSKKRVDLYSLILRDNLLYFSAIACLLVFNNLMVVGVTHIPWFSFGPFHAAIGILTVRMILNLRKATAQEINGVSLTEIQVTSVEEMEKPGNRAGQVATSRISAIYFTSSGTSSTETSTVNIGAQFRASGLRIGLADNV